MVGLTEYGKTLSIKPKISESLVTADNDNVFYVYAEFKIVNGQMKCVNHYGGVKGVKTTRTVKPVKTVTNIKPAELDEEVLL